MHIYLSRFLFLILLLSLFACDGIQYSVNREPARLILTWEEPFDPGTSLEQQLQIRHDLEEKLKGVGEYSTSSTVSLNEDESKRTFNVEFILNSDNGDTKIVKRMQEIFVGRSFSVKIIGAKVTQKIGI
nr:hypothetical protein [uncultured Undibacterium sp.]